MGHEKKRSWWCFSSHASCLIAHASLKRMRAVRADGELQLEEDLVDGAQISVLRVPQLSANLAELRRPEGERRGDAFVAARVVEVGAIEPHAGEPALAELIVERCVETFSIARRIGT